jgi:hypothetical protein
VPLEPLDLDDEGSVRWTIEVMKRVNAESIGLIRTKKRDDDDDDKTRAAHLAVRGHRDEILRELDVVTKQHVSLAAAVVVLVIRDDAHGLGVFRQLRWHRRLLFAL